MQNSHDDLVRALSAVALNSMDADHLPIADPVDPLIRALVPPLDDLEDRYRSAASAALRVARELNRLASSMLEPGRPATQDLPADQADTTTQARLEVNFPDDATLLDFQDMVRSVPGVRHVTSLGGGPGHVTLLIDLESGQPTADALQAAANPTLVCSVCEKVLAEGGSQVSHGLCSDCAAQFLSLKRQRDVGSERDDP